MLLTVADVLATPVVQAGQPEVVCAANLDRPVRWVHVSDQAEIAHVLVGAELILTTGQALAAPESARITYLRSLAAAGVAGLVVELGSYVSELGPVVAATAAELGLPVIALHRVTRFVEITEVVHRVIVADQYAELEFARTVHETFTELSVRRAALTEIVKTAAGMLDASVVLEDLARRVLAATAHNTSSAALLDNWESVSRLLPEGPGVVAVGPHTERWGRLILRSDGVPTPRATMVLERAAQTLTLHRMIDRDRFGLHQQAQTGLIADLIGGRVIDERDAIARAAALGLTRRARYVPLVIEIETVAESDPVAGQRRSAAVVEAVTHGLGRTGASALSAAEHRPAARRAAGRRTGGGRSATELPGTGRRFAGEHSVDERVERGDSAGVAGERVAMILAVPAGTSVDDHLRVVCAAMLTEVRRAEGVRGAAIGVGADADSLLDTASQLAHAADVAAVARSMTGAFSRLFFRSADIRLRGLLSSIRDEPAVQSFAETELGALLRYDIRHDTDLTGTLRSFLDLAGNKTELAKSLTISRPTLYDRLARIERILAVDLDDGESRTSLHAALLVRDLTAGSDEL
ncbi:PucR family transcriptional regulator [Nocardia mangyaensis]|uniref:PucR family transcriptional regulator n=1 Tax=Nocardia mangyaensis TaxID=2213200 RepID=A0A1J0VVJ7_9NOCA|nr:PucR family transcriptional regulator [Nocardia mangyaensis]APE36026.1 PucR family transcriptional regulator [Nocardia mangyaensis]